MYRFLRIAQRNLVVSASRQRAAVPLIPGDGVGPEIMDQVQRLAQSANAEVDFLLCPVTEKFHDVKHGDNEKLSVALETISKHKVCLKGHILARPERANNEKLSLQMYMNRELDAFAHVTKVQSVEGLESLTKHQGVDFVVVRETTEGEYCGEEHEAVPGVVESLKVTTAVKSERIARFAFDYAIKHGRKKVTCVHKANIMKQGDGLFMRTFSRVAEEYPNMESEVMIVDNTCMQLVSNPWQFDVMVMPNLYGNIIENLGAGIVGGAGVVPCAHYSNDIVKFGPGARGTYRSMAGKGVANPTAMFLSLADLLEHVNKPDCGGKIRQATLATIKAGKVLTADMGGNASCEDFTNEVIANL